MRRMRVAATGLAVSLAVAVGVGAEQAQDPAVIDTTMKAVGPAFVAARKALDSDRMDDAKKGAAALSKSFIETEAFFKSHGKTDGVEWAQAAKKAADAIAAAASAEAAKAPVGELGKTCTGCHAAYRDRAADGSYSFKAGT